MLKMNKPIKQYQEERIIETVAKIVLIGLLLYSAYLILKPFIGIIIWAIIIAVTVNPLITIGEKRLHLSRAKVSTLFIIAVMILIIIPSVGLAATLSDTLQMLYAGLKEGTLAIPPPSEKVAAWPIVGGYIYPVWQEASTNLTALLLSHKAEILPIVKSTLGIGGSGLVTFLMFIASIFIAAFLTASSHHYALFFQTVAKRLAGDRGPEWTHLAIMTIRSVVQGVIGIALIQAAAGYIGFVFFDVPFAVVLAFLIMMIAIAQLPSFLILVFPVIYMFSTASIAKAVGFLVFAVILGFSDNALRPFLLGRGVNAPMIIVLLGALGGMIAWGILGLFIGSVLLTVAYKLFMAWTHDAAKEADIGTQEKMKHSGHTPQEKLI